MPTVALYVSGHGFGHAVRSAEVARELLARGARVLVRTEAPLWLFPAAVEPLATPGYPLDVGVAQRDGLELDVEETRRRWGAFADAFPARVEQEAVSLRAVGADVLVGDIPPIAFAAAGRASVPSAALGNFGWDWIYAAWPGFERAIDCVREAYHRADVLLRLPLHAVDQDAFPAFRSIVDLPLIARRATRPRAAVRAELGIPLDARAVLLSFGGFDAASLDLNALGAWRNYLFVLTPLAENHPSLGPPNVRLLPRNQVEYASLLAACDAVVTKPGYGIVADSLANHVPVLYTDRGPFREYGILTKALEMFGRARYIRQDDVRRGLLGPHLDALLALHTPWRSVPLEGACVAAERVLRLALQ
jgi:UDP:flavonoid glycosyltransferase YjiC (YdhE family)